MTEAKTTTAEFYAPEMFCEAIPDDLTCPICSCVMKDAVACALNEDQFGEPCGHSFCSSCISTWLSTSKVCPVCRCALSSEDLAADIHKRRQIRCLKVKCPKAECSATGPLGRDDSWLREHAAVCPFNIVACRYCPTSFQRSAFAAHLRECPGRPTQCDTCCDASLPGCQDCLREHMCEAPTFVWTFNFEEERKAATQFCSDVFSVRGFEFYLLGCPRGDPSFVQYADHLGVFVHLSREWKVGKTAAEFPAIVAKFVVKHPDHHHNNFAAEFTQPFQLGPGSAEDNHGFPGLLRPTEISKFINAEGTMTLAAYVRVVNQQDPPRALAPFASLAETCSLCFMNTMLLVLFHLPNFRRLVYHLPTTATHELKLTGKGKHKPDIAFELQRVFYGLQHGSALADVDTSKLVKAFGWDDSAIAVSQDPHEFGRALLDVVRSAANGTPLAHAFDVMFEGKERQTISCTDAKFQSVTSHAFLDLSLSIKGCKYLMQCFDQHTAAEQISGYNAGDLGRQTVIRKITFERLPNVLVLQLKRFAYAADVDDGAKLLDDRLTFGQTIDLSKYLDSTAAGSQDDPALYYLHSVVVLRGSSSFCLGTECFIRPIPHTGGYAQADWLKFGDDRCRKVAWEDVCHEGYGRGWKANRRAYLLVYIRQSEILAVQHRGEVEAKLREEITDPLTSYVAVSARLAQMIKGEQSERKGAAAGIGPCPLTELQLVIEPHVIGKQLGLGMMVKTLNTRGESVGYTQPQQRVQVNVATTVARWVAEAAAEHKLSADKLQLWSARTPTNDFTRPQSPADRIGGDDLYLRDASLDDLCCPDSGSASTFLLLLKYFDVYRQRFVFVGSGLFSPNQTVREFLMRVRALLVKRGLWDDNFIGHTQAGQKFKAASSSCSGVSDPRAQSGLEAWEERLVTATDIRLPYLRADATLKSCLRSGDVVVVQPMLTSSELNLLKDHFEGSDLGLGASRKPDKPDIFVQSVIPTFCVSVPMMLRQLCMQRLLLVHKLPQRRGELGEPEFALEMPSDAWTVPLATAVCRRLQGADPWLLRLYVENPKWNPKLPHHHSEPFALINFGSSSKPFFNKQDSSPPGSTSLLFYEWSHYPVSDLKTHNIFKVRYILPNTLRTLALEVRVPLAARMSDFVHEARRRIAIETSKAEAAASSAEAKGSRNFDSPLSLHAAAARNGASAAIPAHAHAHTKSAADAKSSKRCRYDEDFEDREAADNTVWPRAKRSRWKVDLRPKTDTAKSSGSSKHEKDEKHEQKMDVKDDSPVLLPAAPKPLHVLLTNEKLELKNHIPCAEYQAMAASVMATANTIIFLEEFDSAAGQIVFPIQLARYNTRMQPEEPTSIPVMFAAATDEKWSDARKRMATRLGLCDETLRHLKVLAVDKTMEPRPHPIAHGDDDRVDLHIFYTELHSDHAQCFIQDPVQKPRHLSVKLCV